MAEPDPFAGLVWLTSREAQAYVRCKTLKGFYEWVRRHHIVRRANGTIAKADLERALKIKRIRRMHPESLKNLRRRRVA